LAALAILNVLAMVLELLPRWILEQYGQYLNYLFAGLIVIPMAVGVLYAFVWHRRERVEQANSGVLHAWMQGIIRYWLAYSIATYGFAKILKTQFQTPDFRLDTPLKLARLR